MSFLNRDKRKEVASDITSQAAAQVANSAMADMQVATDLTDTGMDLFLQAAKATQNVGFDQRKGNLFDTKSILKQVSQSAWLKKREG